MTHPAEYESVIAVAATDSGDARASFSSTGDQVELAAPGEAVYSTWNDDTGYYDPQPVCGTDANDESGCYKVGSGTSMASPHVAGTAALILAANPSWTNDQVRAQLRSTADDLGDAGWDPQYGYGLVDAEEAAATSPSTPVTDIAVTSVEAPGTVGQGDLVNVAVTLENVGNQDVTADVTVTLIDETAGAAVGTQTVVGGLVAGSSAALTFPWDTADASVGDHTLTASHDFADEDASNDAASATVSVADAAGDTMHVFAVDVSHTTAGPNIFVYTSVTIVDSTGSPVSDATVYLATTLPDNSTVTESALTGTDGTVTFKTKSRQLGTYVSQVTDVTHASLTYDPGSNVEAEDSINVE